MSPTPDRRRADDRPGAPPTPTAVGERPPAPSPPPVRPQAPGPVAPDPGAVIEDLRRRLRAEQERSLNATDAMRGAKAEAAQARAEIRELHHRLHVREAELRALQELIADGAAGDGTGAFGPARTGAPTGQVAAGDGETAEGPAPAQALRILAGSVARQLGLR